MTDYVITALVVLAGLQFAMIYALVNRLLAKAGAKPVTPVTDVAKAVDIRKPDTARVSRLREIQGRMKVTP